jgi:hypothetical protein
VQHESICFTITTENVEIVAIKGLYDYNFCLVRKYVEDYVDAEVIFFHHTNNTWMNRLKLAKPFTENLGWSLPQL